MKGDRIQDTDHVLRHLKSTWVDPETRTVALEAFIWAPKPDAIDDIGVSVGWREFFVDNPPEKQVDLFRQSCGLQLKASARFGELNCGRIRAAARPVLQVDVVHDPYPGTDCHSAITGFPAVADDNARTAAALIAECVEALHPATLPPATK